MKLTRDSNGLTLEEIIISGINYIPEFFRYCREFLLQSHDVK